MRHLIPTVMAMLIAVHANATTVMYKSLDQLVTESDGIIVGTVHSVGARYGADNEIYTDVTISSLDVVKSTYHRSDLTVRLQGGRVGDEALEIEGSPKFAEHDRVILFIKGNGESIVPIVGWSQGVMRIKKNANGVEEAADHDGNRIFGINGPHLDKEKLHSPKAHIAGDPIAHVQSQNPKPGLGRNDDGSEARSPKIPVARNPKRAMSGVELIAAIRHKTTAIPQALGTAKELISAEDIVAGGTANQVVAPSSPGGSWISDLPPGLTVPFLPEQHTPHDIHE